MNKRVKTSAFVIEHITLTKDANHKYASWMQNAPGEFSEK